MSQKHLLTQEVSKKVFFFDTVLTIIYLQNVNAVLPDWDPLFGKVNKTINNDDG